MPLTKRFRLTKEISEFTANRNRSEYVRQAVKEAADNPMMVIEAMKARMESGGDTGEPHGVGLVVRQETLDTLADLSNKTGLFQDFILRLLVEHKMRRE